MVFDARVEGCKQSFSCSYRGLKKLNSEIFRGWNVQLGIYYEENSKYLWDDSHSLTKKIFLSMN